MEVYIPRRVGSVWCKYAGISLVQSHDIWFTTDWLVNFHIYRSVTGRCSHRHITSWFSFLVPYLLSIHPVFYDRWSSWNVCCKIVDNCIVSSGTGRKLLWLVLTSFDSALLSCRTSQAGCVILKMLISLTVEESDENACIILWSTGASVHWVPSSRPLSC